jgi:hypothetical protein
LPWAADPQPHYFSTLAVEESAERAARKDEQHENTTTQNQRRLHATACGDTHEMSNLKKKSGYEVRQSQTQTDISTTQIS